MQIRDDRGSSDISKAEKQSKEESPGHLNVTKTPIIRGLCVLFTETRRVSTLYLEGKEESPQDKKCA